MKKRFLFILIIFFFPIWAKAETYYSNYTNYNETLDEVNSSDTVEVIKERRYKLYNEIKNYGDYYIKNNNYDYYPFLDENDYRYSEFSDWSITYPNNYEDRIINSKVLYHYQDMKEVRYLKFNNVSGSNGAFRISELEVYVSDNKVDYSVTCSNCTNDFSYYIKNGIKNENMAIAYNNSSLTIDLNNYYPIDKINIKLFLYDAGIEPKKYELVINRDNNTVSYASVLNMHYFTYHNLNEIVPFDINSRNILLKNPEWYDENISYDKKNSSLTRKVWTSNEYQYKDKLYHYYRVDNVYSKEYYKDLNDNYQYLDENDYKDYYIYRVRNKVEVIDNIIITNKQTVLSDFIVGTDFQIETNVNYSVNGKYYVNFITPFTTIHKDVIIDIEENENDLLKKKIIELENQITTLKDDYESKLILLESIKKENTICVNEKADMELEKNKEIKDLENTVNSMTDKFAALKNESEQKVIDAEKNNKDLENTVSIMTDKFINLKNESEQKVIDIEKSNKDLENTVNTMTNNFINLKNENSQKVIDIEKNNKDLSDKLNTCLNKKDIENDSKLSITRDNKGIIISSFSTICLILLLSLIIAKKRSNQK